MMNISLLSRFARIFALLLLLAAALAATATETENLGLHILPAPGPVTVNGKLEHWDLSGSIFACGDVEHYREQFAVVFRDV